MPCCDPCDISCTVYLCDMIRMNLLAMFSTTPVIVNYSLLNITCVNMAFKSESQHDTLLIIHTQCNCQLVLVIVVNIHVQLYSTSEDYHTSISLL